MPPHAPSHSAPRLRPWIVLLACAVLLLPLAIARLAAGASTATRVGIYTGSEVPADPVENDSLAVNVGVRFTVATTGKIVAIRYYQGSTGTGDHVGSLWTASGRLLSRIDFGSQRGIGWQTADLPTGVSVTPGVTYVASYYAPHGRYAQAQHVFDNGATIGNSLIRGTRGVYTYGAQGFPASSWNGSAYYVDALFEPSGVGAPKPPNPSPSTSSSTPGPAPSTSTASSSPTAAPSSSPAPTTPAPTSSTSSAPAPTGPSPLTLTGVDGGTGYYGRFSGNTLPTSSSYFPIGVWEEQYANAAQLSGYGINTLVNPVGTKAATGSVRTLDALDDEVDMWGGPGSGPWTGNYPGGGTICATSTPCGYTIMNSHTSGIPASTMTYMNYGKGVEFWESDTQAAQFVNQYQSVVSADLYWGTDSDLCQASQGGQLLGTGAALSAATCHQASNYGKTVRRVRSLVSPAGSKPVYNYVEIGHPGTAGGTMPVAEIKPAVWSSLIAGARGIVYFNHSFGGSCVSQHVMFDCDPAIGQTVTAINAQIAALAPVLNSPTVTTGASVTGVDGTVKWDGKNLYAFTQGGAGTGTVSVPCVGEATATVLGENRTIPVHNGTFSDTFADSNAVHLYRIDGGSTCGL